ncbi:M48 family metalloprotease [Iodobacter arcticus]|uniref:M48 family metalloprotease n=1 Tax=Iodobacter arcticus TaxID=590593 RepID=A0ABW2QT11_9NEIS
MEDQASTPAANSQRAVIKPYANEQRLFVIMAVISGLSWLALTLVTFGIIWIIMLVLYLIGLFGFSYFISYVRGNGVRVTAEQFPDLHVRFENCCQIVGLNKRPEFYLMTGNGALNAFATRFLRRYYVVLLSDIVDALQEDTEALNFYIGHELGHIAQKHLVHHWWLVFASWIPLLGTAYSRAREYSCDQYGLACTSNKQSAVHALAVLAAGSSRWKSLNTQAYIAQAKDTDGFWMAVNELTADYPWLCKRVARVENGDAAVFPRRNIFAWLISATIPNTGFGLIGAMVVYIYLLLILVPISMSAYSSHQTKALNAKTHIELSQAYTEGMVAAKLVGNFYEETGYMPEAVEGLGFKIPAKSLIKSVEINPESAELNLALNTPHQDKEIILSPSAGDDGTISWTCSITGKVDVAALPDDCTLAFDESEAGTVAPEPTTALGKFLKFLK